MAIPLFRCSLSDFSNGDFEEYCHWVYRGDGADGTGAACIANDSIRPVRCCSDDFIAGYDERPCNGL